MNDLTENLATPDNSRNCEAPPKLPLVFTVITGIQPARLTKICLLYTSDAADE